MFLYKERVFVFFLHWNFTPSINNMLMKMSGTFPAEIIINKMHRDRSSLEHLYTLWLSLLSWPPLLTLNLAAYSFTSDIILLVTRVSQFISAEGRFYIITFRWLKHIMEVKKNGALARCAEWEPGFINKAFLKPEGGVKTFRRSPRHISPVINNCFCWLKKSILLTIC